MSRKKFWISLNLLVILTSVTVTCFSQEAVTDSIRHFQSAQDHSDSFIPKKMDYGLQIGSGFAAFSGGSAFSTYISPHMSYGISKRFRLSGGITILNAYLNLGSRYSSLLNETSVKGSNTSALVYLSGEYLLGNRITIEGTVYKQFNLFGNTPGYKSFQANDPQGIYMSVRYKIMEHLQFEAGFGYSKGYNPDNPFYANPFGNQYTDPFYHPIH
jgi:hypothetical protein